MELTLNGDYAPSDMLTFTEVPNILTVAEDISGTRAMIVLQFADGLTASADSQYTITLFGDTISNVQSPDNNNNKRFLLTGLQDSDARNVARALRSCANVSAEFQVIVSGVGEITLLSKTIGSKWDNIANVFTTNIPSQYLTMTATEGSSEGFFWQGKIQLSVYEDEINTENYVTTLEKSYYKDRCSFNLSPLMASLLEYGQTKNFVIAGQLLRNNGQWEAITNEGDDNPFTFQSTIGYKTYLSDRFLYTDSTQILSPRMIDGEQITLYTYEPSIPLSVLCTDPSWTCTVNVKNSAEQVIYTTAYTVPSTSQYIIKEHTVQIPQTAWTQAFYVDISADTDTIRYNVIKPLKATEQNTRIFWYNEYGGKSFFDFTSTRTDSHSIDIQTYEQGLLDYYLFPSEHEELHIYANNYKRSFSLTTHLIDEKGRHIFTSLMKSKKIWYENLSERYYLIPKSIEISEQNAYNNIFTAKITFEYSTEK